MSTSKRPKPVFSDDSYTENEGRKKNFKYIGWKTKLSPAYHLSFQKSILLVLMFIGFFTLGYVFNMVSLTNSDFCEKQQQIVSNSQMSIPKESHFLIVVIFSAPKNYERRRVIRRTWLLTKGTLGIRHFFAIGSASLDSREANSLDSEHLEFGDLLLLDSVKDSFSKLSSKLLEIFRWLDAYADFTFLLKVDDDSFVRLDELHSKMVAQQKERLYWGFFDGQARVKLKGKWQEKNWFLCDHYLPYAKGGGYVLTKDLVTKIVQMSELLSLYQNEDVALGTWLSPFDIQRLHDIQFDTEYLSRGCDNSFIVTHKQSNDMMVSKYNTILKSGRLCLSEYRSRNSYEYNWSVPPSLCCNRNNSKIT